MEFPTAAAAPDGFNFITFFWLIVIASMVAMVGRYIRIPYALALVITGLIVGPSHILPQVHLEPDILFTVFLPPLLFESALGMRYRLLRHNWQPIAIYALGGTLLSTLIIGGLAAWLLPLPLGVALVFGALISPTDPISVIAIFKQLRVGKRLSLIMEAESLFNDGIAIVLFTLLLAVAMGQTISPLEGFLLFLKVAIGGALLGAVIGGLASRVMREFDDHLLEITLTTIVAFGSYLLAEALNMSGVIAVVVAGLTMGSYGMQTGMSPTTRLAVSSFWEYAAFAVNSIVFLLVGVEVTLVRLSMAVPAVLKGAVIMLVGRAAAIYLLSPLVNRLHGEIPRSWQHILFWGGLRGALPMALVLGLGYGFPQRSELVLITFGVVLFSLLVQGLSISGVLRKLGIAEAPGGILEYQRLISEILAIDAALEELARLEKGRVLASATYQKLAGEYQRRLNKIEAEIEKLRLSDPSLRFYQEQEARILALRAEKSALREAERSGLLDDEGLQQLSAAIDREMERLRSRVADIE